MSAAPSAPAPPAAPAAKPRKLSFKEQRELEGMEQAILRAEEKSAALEATLNDPKFYTTHSGDPAKLAADLEAARKAVAALYARWAELEAVAAI